MRNEAIPRSVIGVIALMGLMLGLQAFQDRGLGADGLNADLYESVIQVMWPILLTGLIASALIGRTRLGWGFVILAQLHWIGLGAYNLMINDYPFKWILEMRQIPFYFGALPIVVGALNLVLLLLSPTRDWTSPDTSDGPRPLPRES